MAGALAAVAFAAPRVQAQDAAPEDSPYAGQQGAPAAAPAAAPAESAPPPAAASGGSAQADASLSTDDLGTGEGNKHGGFLLAGKVGGIASFNGLSPFVAGGIEIGYVLSGGNIALLLDTTYTAPKTDGEVTTDTRVPGSTYTWEIRQKQLVFQPTFAYRFTMLSDKVTPYAGIGPRIYLIEDVTRGKSGGEVIKDSFERSTKLGFGIPLGAEIVLGPGGLFAEFLFQWGPQKHDTTGDTNLGSGSLFLGYRAIL